METMGRYPSSLLFFGQHIWLQFIKSESKVPAKINDLSLVQVLFQDVLAFFYGLGMLKDFGKGPGRERRDTQLGCCKEVMKGLISRGVDRPTEPGDSGAPRGCPRWEAMATPGPEGATGGNCYWSLGTVRATGQKPGQW